MTNTRDHLREEYTIDTPENVSFGYEVAGIGSRFIGALIDTIILALLLLLLNVALVMVLTTLSDGGAAVDLEANDNWVTGLLIALYALLNFALIWGYYICFEWLNYGQTLGKRVARIRVVEQNGSPVGALAAVVRNLVRVIDFLPGGYGVGLVVMFANDKSRRLGDFAAGTLVVRDQGAVHLRDVLMPSTPDHSPEHPSNQPSAQSPDPAATFSTTAAEAHADVSEQAEHLAADQDWRGVRRLSSADYELVQQTLQRTATGQLDPGLVKRVAGAIATKMGVLPSSYAKLATETVDAALARQFLDDLATAYPRWVR